MTRRATTLVAVLVMVLLVGPGAIGAKKKKSQPNDPSGAVRPELRLTADVQAGFTPLTIHFTARLKNVTTESETFCHAGSFLMLAGHEKPRIVSGSDPACLHPLDEKHISLAFSHEFTARRAGFFEFLAMVKTKEGIELFSNAVPVRVLSSPGGR